MISGRRYQQQQQRQRQQDAQNRNLVNKHDNSKDEEDEDEEPRLAVSAIDAYLKQAMEEVLQQHTQHMTNYFAGKLRKQEVHLAYSNKRAKAIAQKKQQELEAALGRQRRRTTRFKDMYEGEAKKTARLTERLEQIEKEVKHLRAERHDMLESHHQQITRLEQRVSALSYDQDALGKEGSGRSPEEEMKRLSYEKRSLETKLKTTTTRVNTLRRQLTDEQAKSQGLRDSSKRDKIAHKEEVAVLSAALRDKTKEASSFEQHNNFLTRLANRVPGLEKQLKTQTQRLMHSQKREADAKEAAREQEALLRADIDREKAAFRFVRKRLIVKSFWFRSQIYRLREIYKLVLHGDSLLAPEVTCRSCVGVFQFPQTLPCGHTLCAGCLEEEMSATGGEDGEVMCPECERVYVNVHSYPNVRLAGVCGRYAWWHSTLSEIRAHEEWLDGVDYQSGKS